MKKYLEIYNYFKNQIEQKQLIEGTKMTSIRKCCEIFSCSKTTVQSAYFELAANGYIISQPKSGYYVSSIKVAERNVVVDNKKQRSEILYDFNSNNADKESFDFELWRRYIKSALRQDDKLLSYSEPQGEEELRNALADYIMKKRNVITSADRIIVGAGLQNLLHILCALIDKNASVSFPDKSFIQSSSVFNSYGFDIHYRDKYAKIIYVSPSHMTRWGDVMPTKRRLELIKLAKKENSLVIEDDYESDFTYNKAPLPSLHAVAGGENVVYIGSFSKLLLPSIRISFMVLTEELYNVYKEKEQEFTQAASKTEQIALCQFIRDGHIDSQIRKIRKLYTDKTKLLYTAMKKYFDDVQIGDNGLQLKIKAKYSGTKEDFIKELKNNKISVFVEKVEKGFVWMVLSSANVSENNFEKSASILSNICSNSTFLGTSQA